MDSILLVHNTHEATGFVNGLAGPNLTFSSYIDALYLETDNKYLRTQIAGRYRESTPRHASRKLHTDFDRIAAYLEDMNFGLDPVRSLVEVYANRGLVRDSVEGLETKVYSTSIDLADGVHGTDLFLGFYQPNTSFGSMAEKVDQEIPELASQWQSYVASHARSGDPNTYKAKSVLVSP